MGCCSKYHTYLRRKVSTTILFLAILIIILELGMIKPVYGGGSVHRVVTLTNQCTQRYMQVVGRRINALGKVGRHKTNPQAQLLLKSVDYSRLTIQSNQSKEYICFNSKGRLTTRSTRSGGDCIFREILTNNLYTYQSVQHPNFRIGFRRKHGKKLKGDAWRRKATLEKCYRFSKPSIKRQCGSGNDPWAPKVNIDCYPVKKSHRQNPHPRRRYNRPAPNENSKWAPKIQLRSKRIRHRRYGKKT